MSLKLQLLQFYLALPTFAIFFSLLGLLYVRSPLDVSNGYADLSLWTITIRGETLFVRLNLLPQLFVLIASSIMLVAAFWKGRQLFDRRHWISIPIFLALSVVAGSLLQYEVFGGIAKSAATNLLVGILIFIGVFLAVLPTVVPSNTMKYSDLLMLGALVFSLTAISFFVQDLVAVYNVAPSALNQGIHEAIIGGRGTGDGNFFYPVISALSFIPAALAGTLGAERVLRKWAEWS